MRLMRELLFDEANKFEPSYFTQLAYFAKLTLPKDRRRRSYREVHAGKSPTASEDQGDVLYFQIATAPHLICAARIIRHLSWERIERGFEASESNTASLC